MELTILILVSVLLTISSFFLSTIGCICVFATYLALNCCYFFFLKKRREKLKELSVQLDRLLHEGIQLPISDYIVRGSFPSWRTSFRRSPSGFRKVRSNPSRTSWRWPSLWRIFLISSAHH